VKLERPKMLEPKGKGSQAAIQLQYSYFLDSKSGNCFGNPIQLCLCPKGKGTADDHWNLTLTYSHNSGGDCT
jgi:hypothetical protein